MTSPKTPSTPIVNPFGDLYFHDVNGSAFDKVGSEALYRKQFGEKLQKENTLFIFLGTDSGLLPKHLQRKGLPEGSRFIFVEPPEVLERLGEVTPEGGFDNRIFIKDPEGWLDCAKDNGLQSYVFLRNFEFFESIGARDLHIDSYQEVGGKLQSELEQINWQICANLGSEAFYVRQLENLAENMHPAVYLKDVFKGKTAVILGGGPSLDKSLDWIADNRADLVVIAVSRVARRLAEVNLPPDIIVSVDPQDISFEISKEMLLLWENSLFVHTFHVSSKLLGQWRGRSSYLGPRFGWSSPYNDENLSGTGPTVTNTAIDLAIEMGFARLLLTGVDLCFSREGFTHAQGSNEHRVGPRLGIGKLWVETNGGWIAETTPDYHLGITIVAQQAGKARQRNCHLINLSEEAALIPGVDFCPTDKVTLEHQPTIQFEILSAALPDETLVARKDYLNAMISELERAQKAFREIKDLTKEALKANEYFSGTRGNKKGDPSYRKKLDKIEKKLNTKYSDFTPALKHVGIRKFLKVAHSNWDKEWNEADVERLMGQYYETYRDGATRLLDMIRPARERILSRLEEEQENPDFNLIMDQWEKDKQFGRALVWKTRHGDRRIPATLLPRFHSLEKKFESALEQIEKKFGSALEQIRVTRMKTGSPRPHVCGKLSLMFRRGEKDHLERMLAGLQGIERTGAKVLFLLGSGYLAELTGDLEKAAGAYQSVIDQLLEKQNGAALEAALLRVFAISLEKRQTENALLTANCLGRISPAYLPFYADMRCLTGDKVGALDVYAEYLERVRSDITVMLKMGQIYSELEVIDGARLMFESVLKEDPGNKAASKLLSELEGK